MGADHPLLRPAGPGLRRGAVAAVAAVARRAMALRPSVPRHRPEVGGPTPTGTPRSSPSGSSSGSRRIRSRPSGLWSSDPRSATPVPPRRRPRPSRQPASRSSARGVAIDPGSVAGAAAGGVGDRASPPVGVSGPTSLRPAPRAADLAAAVEVAGAVVAPGPAPRDRGPSPPGPSPPGARRQGAERRRAGRRRAGPSPARVAPTGEVRAGRAGETPVTRSRPPSKPSPGMRRPSSTRRPSRVGVDVSARAAPSAGT